MSILRTIAVFLAFVGYLVTRIPHLLWVNRHAAIWPRERYDQVVYRISTRWARMVARITGARFHVSGLHNIPNDRFVLFVSNHQSDLDIIICMSFLPGPKGFVAKVEMLKVPLLRSWMKHMRCVFMDRKDMKQSLKVILEGIEILKSGHNMVVFPEGTRSKSPKMLEFKAGAFKLATKSKVDIVPVSISGSYKIFEANHYRIKPADVYITIHPPLHTAALNAEESAMLPDTVRGIIEQGITV